MDHTKKSDAYRALKDAGITLPKPYQNYTAAEMNELYEHYVVSESQEEPELIANDIPISDTPLDIYAGMHQNEGELSPLRVDSAGRIWYQEELRKKAYAAPRARRKIQYNDPGVQKASMRNGEYLETFEVAGTRTRAAEVKISLPTYQVGIYKDPRFPFKVHVYNDSTGFDLFEVQDFYGGSELVPVEIKRIYVENVLCYDIRTTIRAIETEARQLQLQQMKG